MNILKKQTISIGLCFALAVSTLSAFTPATAAAKAKLVKKKLTLTVGQKKKIAIKSKKKKAKYSFKASNKKASVSKSGVITAKKAGKVKIAVKEKLKKKTRKVGTITVTIKKKIAQNTTVRHLIRQHLSLQLPRRRLRAMNQLPNRPLPLLQLQHRLQKSPLLHFLRTLNFRIFQKVIPQKIRLTKEK